MTVQTNAFLTYDAIGNKENLSEVITSLSPEETPFTSAIGATDAKGILFEWQTDALAAADSNNAVLEGDVVDGTASTPTSREKNYCQISRRDVVVSSTQETVKKAGRSSEMGYQVAKRLKELKRDIEAVIIGNQGYNAGASGTARRTRSIESFLETNVDREAGGANAASATDPATDSGSTRAFTESMLQGVIQSCYTEGASPSILSVGPFNKGVVSGFTGRSQARHAIAEDRIQAAAHLYASDFGEIKVMPNRFQRERTALVIDPEYAEVAYLRHPQVKDLARTGDSERKYVVAEYALCIKNEKAHGMMTAIKNWWDESLGGLNLHATDTGSADTYVLTPAPAITSYISGQSFSFFAANANTGASTINISGVGTKAIEYQGAALISGDIASGDLVSMVYDGTAFQLLGKTGMLRSTSIATAGTLVVGGTTLEASITEFVGAAVGGSPNATGDDVVIRGYNVGLSFLSPNTNQQVILFGDTDDNDVGGIYYVHSTDQMSFRTNGAQAMGLSSTQDVSIANGDLDVSGGGVTVGSPTGGNQGTGTINAQAVYDDGVLLTCYVFDAELDGSIDQLSWDARVPNREIPEVTREDLRYDGDGNIIVDEFGTPEIDVIEVAPAQSIARTHGPAAGFASRSNRDLDPDLFFQDMVTRRALPAMPTRDEWALSGPLSTGDIVQRLWETVEVQAVHTRKLLSRIESLEAQIPVGVTR